MKKIKIISLVVFFISISVCFGQSKNFQQNKIDSISKVINTTNEDTILAKAYLDLSDVMYISNFDTVLVLCN